MTFHVATVQFDVTTSGKGTKIVEVGVYPIRLTLLDGRVIQSVDVPATVDVRGVAVTLDFRGSSLLINDHGAAGIRIAGDVFGRKAR